MTKLYDYDQLFPTRFLKAGQLLGQKVPVTIAAVDVETLPSEKGDVVKGVVTLKNKDAQWVLNRTNAECLKAMFGRVVADWIGKRVTLHGEMVRNPDREDVHNKTVLAIRVYGSPDIERDITFRLKLAKKAAVSITLRATGKTQAEPEPEPPVAA